MRSSGSTSKWRRPSSRTDPGSALIDNVVAIPRGWALLVFGRPQQNQHGLDDSQLVPGDQPVKHLNDFVDRVDHRVAGHSGIPRASAAVFEGATGASLCTELRPPMHAEVDIFLRSPIKALLSGALSLESSRRSWRRRSRATSCARASPAGVAFKRCDLRSSASVCREMSPRRSRRSMTIVMRGLDWPTTAASELGQVPGLLQVSRSVRYSRC